MQVVSRAWREGWRSSPHPRKRSVPRKDSRRDLGRTNLFTASAIDRAVSAVAVATMSASRARPLERRNSEMNSRPNSSLPAVFGGFARKKGLAKTRCNTGSITLPEAAIVPVSSKGRLNSCCAKASITMFPGPVSKASMRSRLAAAGMAVRFAIPPMFCAILPIRSSRNQRKSR